MKVYSIVNNSYKINAYKGNIHLTSFMGNDEVNIQKPKPQEATLAQKITASLAKIKSDKYVKLSKDLLQESGQIKGKATLILEQAKEAQRAAKELSEANSNLFLNEQVTCSQSLIVYDTNLDGKTMDAYVFDTKTRTLKQYMKNVNVNDSSIKADECFSFGENGELVAFDRYFAEALEGHERYKKSFERYIFDGCNLEQCYSQYNETIGKTISFDDVLMFDDNELSYYVENGYINSCENVQTFGVQMVFNDNQIQVCSNGVSVHSDGEQEHRKRFIYSDKKLQQVQYDAHVIEDECASSRQTIEYVNNKPFCCRISNDSNGETVAYFKK